MIKAVTHCPRVGPGLLKKVALLPLLAMSGFSSLAEAADSDKKISQKKDNQQNVSKQETSANRFLSSDKKIHLNGVTITPGGFFAVESLWRSRNEQSDIGSTFSGIPTGNMPLAHMNEFRLSARQSRISALVEGLVHPGTLLSGYAEIDFLGNGTANENESNSFNPRIRNLYAAIDQHDAGWHLLAGQNWSLVTTNNKGITPRNEMPPPTIDAQYVVGFAWKRQPQLRVTKNFGEKVWAAVSVENPQTTFGGVPAVGNGVATLFDRVTVITATAPGAQTLPSSVTFSLNHVPDVIAKLAFEPNIENHHMHIEGFGLYRDFYDRVEYINNLSVNKDSTGWGAGSGLLVEILPKRLDFQGSVIWGEGIGSYVTGLLPDVTIASDGSLAPIPEVAFLLGATVHATKALDLYVFGGMEQEEAKFFKIGNNFFGYGVPNANNSGCNIENSPNVTCAGSTESLWQVTGGLWDKVYNGIYGELRLGLQYSYTKKKLFNGHNDIGYSTDDNMVFGSIRYYPFSVPEAPKVAMK